MCIIFFLFFFFSSRRRHTRCGRDWSSDVCSSDLLLIRELLMRADAKRILIMAPGGLTEQWQDELLEKFGLQFEIFSREKQEQCASGNYFEEADKLICRLDQLSRNPDYQDKLRNTDWDLIIVDEAHKLSANYFGNKVNKTRRFELGELLSSITRHFLLMTATPHNGKEEDFQIWLSLLDGDRFYGKFREGAHKVDVSDMMRRMIKEELLKFDGTRLFPERLAYTANYELSDAEAALYAAVTDYVRNEMNRADNLDGKRRGTVGFALTQLQRRLASSPEAIYQSLKRRRKRLESRLEEEKLIARGVKVREGVAETLGEYAVKKKIDLPDDIDELDDALSAEEYELYADQVVDQATAAETIPELEAEILILKDLEQKALGVVQSGNDKKWEELSHLLQDRPEMYTNSGTRRKLIIFTEHKDTLNYLVGRIGGMLGKPEAVITIHGGTSRDDRRKAQEEFRNNPDVLVLVATDAAGEGVNLQNANLMVNYDLPWNPNRLEQRFGRIHRIGQTEVCHLWNLVSRETREGMVFQRLFEKLEQERETLKGKVFDVLGKVSFDNKPLRDLLIEAIRYGNDPAVRDRLNQVVDHSLNHDELQRLLDENALTEDTMDVHRVMAIREDMERMEAHKLQPHFIESFFIEAFQSVGGKIRAREKGRYEITSVPFAVRNRDMQIGFGEPVLSRYERVCFDKPYCNIQGQVPAALIAPGHPLLEATIDLVRERNMDVLKRGAVFVDDTDSGTDARLLFYIEDSVQDGVILPNGSKRVISKHIHFVEIKEDGTAVNAGYAPYLDYRAAKDEEAAAIRTFLNSQSWLSSNVEDIAIDYAINKIIPAHVK